MSEPPASPAMKSGSRLPGFDLAPLGRGHGRWFVGRNEAGSGRFLVRRIAGLPFTDVVHNLATVVDLLDARPTAANASPVAIVVTSDGRTVAGSSARSSGIRIEADGAHAAALEPQSPVDVWVAYDEIGEEALDGCDVDPRAASGRLGLVAEVLDAMAAGHGALDSVSLRMTPAGPLVLSAGLAAIESLARNHYDDVEPWLTVSPERCLPPGLPTSAGDQYALAVLWTVARTGRLPHEAPTAEPFVRAKLTDPPRLEGLEPAEGAVLARAMSISAEARFKSSTAFAKALHDVFIVAPQAAASPSPPALAPAPPLALQHESPARPGNSLETRAVANLQGQVVIPAELRPLPAASATATGLSVVLATAPYKPGDLVLPGYRLERLLGKGGFGEVWRASAPGGMRVAIKVIGNLGRREGAREFRALRTITDIHHAHIVPIFGIWLKTADGRLLDEQEASWAGERILTGKRGLGRGTGDSGSGAALESLDLVVAMGLGDGTLHDELTQRHSAAPPGLEPGRLLVWMRQAALAIDHFNRGQVRDGATSTAVQHCDIKPQNMLLVGDVVQVCDFGLARVQGQARATANNLVSIAYAAPEMMVRPFNPSPTTDQYSLAVSYYELRTGRLPYGDRPTAGGEEMSAVELMRLKTEGAVDLSLVSPREQKVLKKALALEPAERFGSCEELVDRLDAALDADETPAAAPGAKPFPWLRAGGIAIGGAVALALGAWVSWPKPKPPLLDDAAEARAEFDREIEAALRPDGGLLADHLQAALKVAESLGRVAPREGERLTASVDAVRSISLILGSEHPEPAGVDEAVARLDRAAADLPPPARERLGAGLAERIIDRAERRLQDHELSKPDAPTTGKTRAIDDSVQDIQVAIRLAPNSWRARSELGFCESLRGRYREAAEEYGRALAMLDAESAEPAVRDGVLRRRAYAHKQLGDFAEAADDYAVLLADDPRLLTRLWDLQQVAQERKDYSGAVAVLERMETLMNGNPARAQAEGPPADREVLGELAWLLACGFGRDPAARAVAAAQKAFEQVIELPPGAVANQERASALDTLAAAYARAGRFADAMRTADEALAVPGIEAEFRSDFESHRKTFEQGRTWDFPAEAE